MNDTTWRLLVTPAHNGAMNMALDQAIMESVAAGYVPPTLRFYAWEPACLSLGYTQPITDVDRARLMAQGWDLVRRMTGGRAILHTDELTYSVALKKDHPLVAGDIVASYRHLSRALVAGLEHLGADPHADKRADGHNHDTGPVCFEVPSHYEITVYGKKLVGSAQVRKFDAVLQHGTLPLHGDIARIVDALIFNTAAERENARQRVRERAATLEDALGVIIAWRDAVDALTRGFVETFALNLQPEDTLTPNEQTRANELYATRYTTQKWNTRF